MAYEVLANRNSIEKLRGPSLFMTFGPHGTCPNCMLPDIQVTTEAKISVFCIHICIVTCVTYKLVFCVS